MLHNLRQDQSPHLGRVGDYREICEQHVPICCAATKPTQ